MSVIHTNVIVVCRNLITDEHDFLAQSIRYRAYSKCENKKKCAKNVDQNNKLHGCNPMCSRSINSVIITRYY